MMKIDAPDSLSGEGKNIIQIEVIDDTVYIWLSNWKVFPCLYGRFLIDAKQSTGEDTLCIEKKGQSLREEGGSDLDFISFFDRVIKWSGTNGSRVNGILYGKFREDNISKENADPIIAEIIRKAAECLKEGKIECAIKKIIDPHGLGISYGSKILRMLSPEKVGVYDSVLAKYLPYDKDVENKEKGAENYAKFCADCQKVVDKLNNEHDAKKATEHFGKTEGGNKWRIADVEAVLFFACSKKQKIEVTYEL